jgi:hypothetical protein
MVVGDLIRLDNRPVSDNRDEIRAFLVVWNDMLRLESALNHYRRLGVHRFFVVDVGSTDGTLDHLAAAPDVHAFSGRGEGDGIDWLNVLLDEFGEGRWSLTVDVDELFIYPHYEQMELPLFCRYLNHVGSEAVLCVSLDMYAASPIQDAIHRPGAPLLTTCHYFDAQPYRIGRTDAPPYFTIHGGVRERLVGSGRPDQSPILSRVPLVRWQVGTRYLRGTANITAVRVADVLGALLRFEFLSDFPERSQGGSALAADAATNLYSSNSVRFENSGQLVNLGLMNTARAYEESIQLTLAARSSRSA